MEGNEQSDDRSSQLQFPGSVRQDSAAASGANIHCNDISARTVPSKADNILAVFIY